MDYARAIVEFFVERRGKGSAISSADEQLVLLWEGEGIPVPVVFAGIDTAFERKADPPKSLSDCGRWVKAAYRKWAGGDLLASAAHTTTPGAAAHDAPAASRPTPAVPTVEQALIAELEARAAIGHEALRAAVASVLAEIRDLAARGPLEPEVVAVVDEAIADAALERLPAPERTAIIATAEGRLAGRRMSGAAWAAARAKEIVHALT